MKQNVKTKAQLSERKNAKIVALREKQIILCLINKNPIDNGLTGATFFAAFFVFGFRPLAAVGIFCNTVELLHF